MITDLLILLLEAYMVHLEYGKAGADTDTIDVRNSGSYLEGAGSDHWLVTVNR